MSEYPRRIVNYRSKNTRILDSKFNEDVVENCLVFIGRPFATLRPASFAALSQNSLRAAPSAHGAKMSVRNVNKRTD